MGMKHSSLKRFLKEKIEEIANSIEDQKLANEFKTNVIITGGCITSMLIGEKINDYDCYFKDKGFVKEMAKYYIESFNSETQKYADIEIQESVIKNIKGEDEERIKLFIKSDGIVEQKNITEQIRDLNKDLKSKDNKFKPILFTDNAITLKNKVQLIIRFFGNPAEIHKNFDYVHSMGYYDYANNNLEISYKVLECCLSKTLKYEGSLYPIASLFRLRKFIQRGWKISAGEILKIAFQISNINLSDKEILKEQLIGVDMTFMKMLIEDLNNMDKNDRIDETYIAKLIDRIFEDEEIEEHYDVQDNHS